MRYKTVEGSAKASDDYVEADGVLTISKGAKSGEILLSIIGDTQPEASQSFTVVLTDPKNAQFINVASELQSTVTIQSDDGDSLPKLTIPKTVANDEGNSGNTDFKVTLKLSKPATDTITLAYETRSGEARAGSDFEAKAGVVTFLAGDVEQTLILPIYGDEESEEDEEFVLVLTDPTGVQFANGEATQEIPILIQDDDSEPPKILEGTAKNDKLSVFDQGDGLGDDTLNGRGGADTMIGGDGDDTYYVDNPKDVIIEEDQSDSAAGDADLVRVTAPTYKVAENVERVVVDGKGTAAVTGNGLDNDFIGNAGANTFVGLGGEDTFDGGSGKDVLTGGEGSDVFKFSSGVKGGKNVDTIKDFTSGVDKIHLSREIFTKLAEVMVFSAGDDPAPIDAYLFVSGVGVKATSATSYLLYDTKTGRMSYDADGNGKGAADWFLTLVGKPILTADDLYLF